MKMKAKNDKDHLYLFCKKPSNYKLIEEIKQSNDSKAIIGRNNKNNKCEIIGYKLDKNVYSETDDIEQYKALVKQDKQTLRVDKKLIEAGWKAIASADAEQIKEQVKFYQVFFPPYKEKVKDSKDLLEQMAKNYKPKWLEASLQIDHQWEGPAYGWITKLKYENKILYAQFKDVDEFIIELNRSGAYKYVSIGYYFDYDNKGPYLGHLALLGAANPAVPGLGEFKLSTYQNDSSPQVASCNFKLFNELRYSDIEDSVQNKGDKNKMSKKPNNQAQLDSHDAIFQNELIEARSELLEKDKKIAELEKVKADLEKQSKESVLTKRKVEYEAKLSKLEAEGKIQGSEYEAYGSKSDFINALLDNPSAEKQLKAYESRKENKSDTIDPSKLNKTIDTLDYDGKIDTLASKYAREKNIAYKEAVDLAINEIGQEGS